MKKTLVTTIIAAATLVLAASCGDQSGRRSLGSASGSITPEEAKLLESRLMGKAQRVEAGVRGIVAEGEDPSSIAALMDRVSALMEEGRVLEAEKLLDKALALAEGASPESVEFEEDLYVRPGDSKNGCRYDGPLLVEKDFIIENDCEVNGDLLVRKDATLTIDYSQRMLFRGEFVLRGNLTVEGNGKLLVKGSERREAIFVVSSDHNFQRKMYGKGSATVELEYVDFRTVERNKGDRGSINTTFDGRDKSKLIISHSVLDPSKAWMLGNFYDQSYAKIVSSNRIPTENYIHGASTLEVEGSDTVTGLWMDGGQTEGVLNLPDVSRPFTWEVSRETGFPVSWTVRVTDAKPGLGLQSRPGSKITVNGRGGSDPELQINYFVGEGVETMDGFGIGLHNGAYGGGRLRLNNVNKGPIGWLVYVENNEKLHVKNSIINEIAVNGTGHIEIEDSLLQLAAVAAIGPDSSITIKNCEMWNQLVMADGKGRVTIIDTEIHAASFQAQSQESSISIVGGRMHDNPSGCREATMLDFATGQPKCNPFRVPGPSTAIGVGTVTCKGTKGCTF